MTSPKPGVLKDGDIGVKRGVSIVFEELCLDGLVLGVCFCVKFVFCVSADKSLVLVCLCVWSCCTAWRYA